MPSSDHIRGRGPIHPAGRSNQDPPHLNKVGRRGEGLSHQAQHGQQAIASLLPDRGPSRAGVPACIIACTRRDGRSSGLGQRICCPGDGLRAPVAPRMLPTLSEGARRGGRVQFRVAQEGYLSFSIYRTSAAQLPQSPNLVSMRDAQESACRAAARRNGSLSTCPLARVALTLVC